MATLDSDARELRLLIIVLGGASEEFSSQLPLQGGELHLAEVHGFAPRLTLRRFSADPWANPDEAADLERLLPEMDGLVLTDALTAGAHYSSAAIERLAQSTRLHHPNLPVAIVGGPALVQEWSTLVPNAPVYANPPDGQSASAALKALLRVLLKKVSPSGQTTPPPSVR